MVDLTPITALGALSDRVETFGALTISEQSDKAMASMVLDADPVGRSILGMSLPRAGGYVEQAPYSVFWMSPGQWMVCAEGLAEQNFAAEVKVHAELATITEQTDGWAALSVISNDGSEPVRALLTRLVNLDQKQLAPGTCQRTGLHHMSVFVIRPSEDKLILIGMRSLAETLWQTLAEAAKQLGT